MSTWIPLESNPEVLNKYIRKLGVPNAWALTDVFSLDPEMLEWIPKPVKSIILLFPISETYEKHRLAENENLSGKSQTYADDLFYMRQITHNACGTVALIHSIANNKDIVLDDGVLKDFLEKTKDLSPDERAIALENDQDFSASHQDLAQEGQTEPTNIVIHHFISFVNVDGTLYELDGRKSFPIKHGATNDESFVRDTAKVCKEFMARDPQEVRFTVLALAGAQE